MAARSELLFAQRQLLGLSSFVRSISSRPSSIAFRPLKNTIRYHSVHRNVSPYRPCLSNPPVLAPITYRTQHVRHRSTKEAATVLFRHNPFSVSFAVILILLGAGSLVYANYYYTHYIIGQFAAFPEPVAKKLRRALYYSNMSVSPPDAVRYYREALAVADELGMDPFSDEVLGIKIQLAAFLERIQQFPKAIEVLERVKADCLKWVEVRGGAEGKEAQRTKVLGKTVGMSVKLGELYANQYVMEKDKAEENLVWAVETVLKELKRREEEGEKPDEGPWMDEDQIGGALESLAHHYEAKDQHYLAAPLFLQALTLSPPSTCHSVVLMNNLSISIAQQSPPPQAGTPPVSRPALVNSGRAWARKALEVAAQIRPPVRNDECDVGCAVATHNLAEFAAMEGDLVAARRGFEEARSLAEAIGYVEGVENAEEGLGRVKR